MTELAIPDLSLVVLIGTTGSGKSTFARRHFLPTQVVSSDVCRGLVADDENDQSATPDAFDLLHYIAAKRLAAGRLTVVDATNVQREARARLVGLAREHDVLPVAVVLDVPEPVCRERNATRPDRAGLPGHVLPRQLRELRRSLGGLRREGFRHIHVLRGTEEVDAARVVLRPRFNDLRHLTGPFDIIGDVHGCRSELETLLGGRLGYAIERDGRGRPVGARHPEGRTAVFVGDLVDRGPDSPGVLRLVMGMVADGTALCVPGNHEEKLSRYLAGRRVKVAHGLAETIEQLERVEQEEKKEKEKQREKQREEQREEQRAGRERPGDVRQHAEPDGGGFRERLRAFLSGLVSHYVLDGGRLVVAHAGLPERYHGRTSGRVRAHALYGETTGETDEFGLPVRYPWAEDYRGRAAVVYGHTPVPRASWLNNTICLDTGAVFGGRLTALRWPERQVVDTPAERVWYEPVRPLATDAPGGGDGRPLDLADVQGRRIVTTRHAGRLTVREENAAAALEVMSRFAVDPRLLLYLPPTMAPCATAAEEGYLEHPAEAFAAYRAAGVREVICEEKHMGSRAVVLVARDPGVPAERFGAEPGTPGAVWTRTGRAFFDDGAVTARLLERLATAVGGAGLWEELDTDWLLLDAELMPWSLKAGGLLRHQYAAVGAAARAAFPEVLAVLEAAEARGVALQGGLRARQHERAADAAAFTDAYRRYCWPTGSDHGDHGDRGDRGNGSTGAGEDAGGGPPSGVRLAPFGLLAAEGRSLAGLAHDRQLALVDRMIAAEPRAPGGAGLLAPTRRLVVDTADEASVAAGTGWWLELTAAGGEGMVVKPLAAQARDGEGRPVQPGIKCRGREYLRIVYGPEYTRPENLSRLRERHLGHKRSLALREHALGLEALDRLAAGEPLWRVHEAVFAVLALESEPVDPRL
ncbi:polynucleotide kinase-phosphatase [Streptomyces sp. YIM 98790]|uniref:polynucleotide kinase-phosphatase n=1 Tax=Streptomyces sp. YIM 98790 TaxID=2689077 RepID=UPI00140B564B|nr:polynucleotide kinase-phosphatase [Streptomyces sp. YIM 98790]